MEAGDHWSMPRSGLTWVTLLQRSRPRLTRAASEVTVCTSVSSVSSVSTFDQGGSPLESEIQSLQCGCWLLAVAGAGRIKERPVRD